MRVKIGLVCCRPLNPNRRAPRARERPAEPREHQEFNPHEHHVSGNALFECLAEWWRPFDGLTCPPKGTVNLGSTSRETLSRFGHITCHVLPLWRDPLNFSGFGQVVDETFDRQRKLSAPN